MDPVGVDLFNVAALDHAVELGKAGNRLRMVLRHLDLTVVTGDTGKGLEGDVKGVNSVQHPDGMKYLTVLKPDFLSCAC